MPRDGAGNYTLPVNSVDPAVFNTTISDVDFNATMNDLATGLTNSFDRTGNGSALAVLSMGGFKLINVGVPAATGDALRLDTVNGSVPGLTGGAFAAAGKVGEVVVGASTISLTTGVTANVTSITPTAGIWLLFAAVSTIPAGGTITTTINAGISTTSASLATIVQNAIISIQNTTTAGVGEAFYVGTAVVPISSGVTYYLAGNSSFSGGTMNLQGRITALRIA